LRIIKLIRPSKRPFPFSLRLPETQQPAPKLQLGPDGLGCLVMAFDAHNLRDILSLARLLRRFAQEHHYDANHVLFLATAVALEGRAHLLATSPDGEPARLEYDLVLHAPVNQLV
jgi:hypothetical protein